VNGHSGFALIHAHPAAFLLAKFRWAAKEVIAEIRHEEKNYSAHDLRFALDTQRPNRSAAEQQRLSYRLLIHTQRRRFPARRDVTRAVPAGLLRGAESSPHKERQGQPADLTQIELAILDYLKRTPEKNCLDNFLGLLYRQSKI
jgi:hypothetical protein